MNTESDIVATLKTQFPKYFIVELTDNNLKFTPEKDEGHIEYKRTLVDCSDKKAQQYATQMRWRILENTRNQCATYFIGIDDDGKIVGLRNNEIINCIEKFISITKTINASITGIQIIHINEFNIIKINVKIKKIQDNYLVDFVENV